MTKKTTRRARLAVLAGVLAMAFGVWMMPRTPESPEAPRKSEPDSEVQNTGESATEKLVRPASAHEAEQAEPDASEVSETDQRQAETMRDFLDDAREQDALAVARSLMKSKDAHVRTEVVETLGWIGLPALPELTSLLNDPSAHVAGNAFKQWTRAFEEIGNTDSRAEFLTLAMKTLEDGDALDMLVMEYIELPDDVAVRKLTEVILHTGTAASAVARAQYEFITGDEFTTATDSEQWIKDNVPPEN